MNQDQSIIRAALGGTAVAFMMIGATLFWVSSQQKEDVVPLFEEKQSEQSLTFPSSETAISPASENAQVIFSSSPKKVKSLIVPTQAD